MRREIAAKQHLSKEEINRLEQRALSISLATIIFIAFGSIAYGLYIKSDVVILNGVLSMISLLGSALNLWGAKLVLSPENDRFQYGYWHIEPLIHSANALILLLICIYALINGIEGLRSGGNVVDSLQVMLFSAVTGVICGVIWLYEVIVADRIGSQFVKNDAKEWFLDFSFSMVTLIGFVPLFFLDYPFRDPWQRYADSTMVIVLSLFLAPYPLRVLIQNIPEILLMSSSDEALIRRLNKVLSQIGTEHKIIKYSSHIAKVGQKHFIEVNILVDPNCELQTIVQQDQLRSRIWEACQMPLDKMWLTVCITADKRWS